MSPDGMSFKEWAFATDTFGQAVYMERWSRHNVQEGASSTMTSPYLAMRRLPREGTPEAFLVLVGPHFALARGRPSLPAGGAALRQFSPEVVGGGCASLADDAMMANDRIGLERLIDIEGSVGEVVTAVNVKPPHTQWLIKQSTHPWREGRRLFWPGDLEVVRGAREGGGRVVQWSGSDEHGLSLSGMWSVLEWSGDDAALEALLMTSARLMPSEGSRRSLAAPIKSAL